MYLPKTMKNIFMDVRCIKSYFVTLNESSSHLQILTHCYCLLPVKKQDTSKYIQENQIFKADLYFSYSGQQAHENHCQN